MNTAITTLAFPSWLVALLLSNFVMYRDAWRKYLTSLFDLKFQPRGCLETFQLRDIPRKMKHARTRTQQLRMTDPRIPQGRRSCDGGTDLV